MNTISLPVDGMTAYWIERAHHSSFYGIHGDRPDCYTAQRLAADAIRADLTRRGIDWAAFSIHDAEVVNTEGTKIPYAAIIYYTYDPIPT